MKINLYGLLDNLLGTYDVDSYTVTYLKSRFKREGIQFLTVTLPKLGKALIQSLEYGYFCRETITCFAWKGRSLRCFRSLLDKIFCQKGILRPDACASSILALRQISEYFYKLSLEFTDTQLSKATDKHLSIQERLHSFQFDSLWVNLLRKNAETYYPGLFVSPDTVLKSGPRNGPGSIADSTPVPYYIWKQLDDKFCGTHADTDSAYSGYFKPYPSAPTPIHSVKTPRVSKVLFVPKDSRGPRVISKEPMHVLRPQMAFFSYTTKYLEDCTRNRINFVDQGINRSLAQRASVDRANSTMDLKDASDSVAVKLVRRIFRNSPMYKWFLNRRSAHYAYPCSTELHQLHSVAGMGSGLTFPTMAFLIHLSVCTEASRVARIPYENISKLVYVYGDDLIVPTWMYDHAISGLTKSGLIVNADKSFSKGNFRESCGGDYFMGIECSPTRLRLSNSGLTYSDGNLIACNIDSAIKQVDAHAKELRLAGLSNLAEYFEVILKSFVPMPFVGVGSPAIGVLTDDVSKIHAQGKFDPATSINSVRYAVALPVSLHREDLCPFKYLSSYLSRDKKEYIGLDLYTQGCVSRGARFGDLPIPRQIKIRTVKGSVLNLYPVV